jgi:Domain of unknown function (DUF4224)
VLVEDKPSEQGLIPATMFLNPDELAMLTGFHRKGRQVEQLRHMGIAFYINGCGRPVVARTSIEGRAKGASPCVWTPSVVKLSTGA